MTKKSTQSKVLTIRVPDSENLKEVQRQARQLVRDEWEKAHPDAYPNKGGRPPKTRSLIFQLCDEIWELHQEEGRLKSLSQGEMKKQVQMRLHLIDRRDGKTPDIDRQVRAWYKQLPLHFWPKAKLAQNPKALELSVLGLINLKINRELYWPWLLKKMPKGKAFNELVKLEESRTLVPPRSLKQKMEKEFARLLKDTLAKDPSLEKRLRRYNLLP